MIMLRGVIVGTSQSDVEQKIDTFKELFSRPQKNLDITWGGSTRRYVATCERHDFDRDHFNILFVPWTAEFIVPEGTGEESSETTLLNNQSFQATSYSAVATFAGSAKPKPRIRVKCASAATGPKGFSIENTDDGSKIIITRAAGFGAGKYFEIDSRLKTVKYDGDEIPFFGIFPKFKVGANNYKVDIGEILDQKFDDGSFSSFVSIYDVNYMAQSFMVPYKDATYNSIGLLLRKQGTPPNDLVIKIVEDLNGEPDESSPVANAEFTIAPGDVGLSEVFIKARTDSLNAYELEANKRYWIVAKMTGGDASNRFFWGVDTAGSYKKGNTARTTDDGVNWTDNAGYDSGFRVYHAGIKEDSPYSVFNVDIFYYKKYL
jgi:hypothetical protein